MVTVPVVMDPNLSLGTECPKSRECGTQPGIALKDVPSELKNMP